MVTYLIPTSFANSIASNIPSPTSPALCESEPNVSIVVALLPPLFSL